MKYFSIFSGIGGFELGLNKHGFECVGYSEIDKHAIQVYEKHFSGVKNYGDATKIDPRELPDFDMLCGGFPCQAFSIAGKRRGFEDTRGTLFFEIARIAKAKRPKYMLLENVKGLLNHNKGETFRVIIQALWELGYDVQWMVLNSKFFGVPQNRERVFFICNLRDQPRPEILSFREDAESTNEKDGRETQRIQAKYSGTLNSTMYKNQPTNTFVVSLAGEGDRDNPSITMKNESGTIPANPMSDRQPLIAIPVLTPDRTEKRQNGRRFKKDGEPSFTLTGQDRHGLYDGMRIRRLTPLECERLQGFPDGWTAGASDSQRYKMLGNAVTVNVIEAIGARLEEMKNE